MFLIRVIERERTRARSRTKICCRVFGVMCRWLACMKLIAFHPAACVVVQFAAAPACKMR